MPQTNTIPNPSPMATGTPVPPKTTTPPPPPPSSTNYQSEVQSAIKGPMLPSGNSLPSTQEALLQKLAYIAASYDKAVTPGNVTQRQQKVLEAWRNNANADFSQFTRDQAFSAVAQNPDVLFNEEMAATQVDWSYGDAKASLQALGLSAADWAKYEKFRQEDAKRKAGIIMGAAEFVAGAAITYFSGGALSEVGVPMMVQGGQTMMGSYTGASSGP